MKLHPFSGYKQPSENELDALHAKVKELVAESKKILQHKKGIHGYYITPYVSDEIELAFNNLCEAEELFNKDVEYRKNHEND